MALEEDTEINIDSTKTFQSGGSDIAIQESERKTRIIALDG